MWFWKSMKISWTYLVINEDVLHRVEEEKNRAQNMKRRKTNWIYKFSVESASKHVIEVKIEGTGRGERRRKEQLDDLKDTKRYKYFKEELLDHTKWRTRFRSGCGHLARQVTKLTKRNK
jgi:CRISPR/Cas system CMR-associated protein Cmr5 small subunit